MNFNDYQSAVKDMPLYDDPILGLVGEVGEVVEHIKKSRRPEPRTKPINHEDLALELGDVFWYLTTLATQYGLSLEDIAKMNIEKLEKRHASKNS